MVLPFITLALGAALTYSLTLLAEKRRTQREDDQRWHTELRLEAAQLVSLAHRSDLNAPDLNDARAEMTDDQDADTIRDYLKYSGIAIALMTEIYLVNSTIKIIASSKVAAEANKLTDVVAESIDNYSAESSKKVDVVIKSFLLVVRSTLGVSDEQEKNKKSTP